MPYTDNTVLLFFFCQSQDDCGITHSSSGANLSLSSSSNTFASDADSTAERSDADGPVLAGHSKSDIRSDKCSADDKDVLHGDVEQRESSLSPKNIAGQLHYCRVSVVFQIT